MDYWHKQTLEQPLFPDLLWSRPENRALAGKLLIIGGNSFGFAAVGEAYAAAVTAGIGTGRVLLPDALRKIAGPVLENGEYAPSTPSGSFSQKALAEWLAQAAWADGVLLSGDIAKNSETAILIEKFLEKYHGQVTITKDAADYVVANPRVALDRENTLLVVSFAQLQKIFIQSNFEQAITYDMDLLKLAAVLHDFTLRYPVAIMVKQLNTIYTAFEGQVSTTSLPEAEIWRVKTAAHASVWWLQNPSKTYNALTTSLIQHK